MSKCKVCGKDLDSEKVCCIVNGECSNCSSKRAKMVERGKNLYKKMQEARREETVLVDPSGIEHNFKSRKEAFEFVAEKTGRTFYHCKKMFYVKDSFAGFTIKNFK